MRALIVNDVHISPKRVGGTTVVTAELLRARLQLQLHDLIMGHVDKHLVINGDLLDEFTIDAGEIINVFYTLHNWVNAAEDDCKLWLCAGNHDRSARGNQVSSFELLCRMLESAAPHKVVAMVEGELRHMEDNVWAIPHCDNSDLFDLELEKALEQIEPDGTLFLHCNYDSPWEHKDHSLNLPAEMAQRFVDKGIRLVIAHEHQKRVLKNGMVYITGNQFASSIADCLGNDTKYAHILEDDGSITPTVTMVVTDEYIEVDWTDLGSVDDQLFIRVGGKATAAQAAEVIGAISKFRQQSEALIVTNAVKIEGAGSIEDFDGVSLEQIKAFDVLASLLDQLEAKQQKAVKLLLED